MRKNLILLSLLTCLIVPKLANAYSFTTDFSMGFYWQSFPIGMTMFTTDVSDGVVLANAVLDAQEQWEDAVGQMIWSIPADPVVSKSYYGNTVRWATDFAAETGYDPTYTLALTIRHQVGTYIVRSEIIINSSYSGLNPDGYLNQSLLRKVILHEMGHTFGLGHTDQPGIMQPYVGSYSSLYSDDIKGAQEVIKETVWRQETGYVSPYAYQEDDNIFSACATVGGDSDNFTFLLSVITGLLAIVLIRRVGGKIFRAI